MAPLRHLQPYQRAWEQLPMQETSALEVRGGGGESARALPLSRQAVAGSAEHWEKRRAGDGAHPLCCLRAARGHWSQGTSAWVASAHPSPPGALGVSALSRHPCYAHALRAWPSWTTSRPRSASGGGASRRCTRWRGCGATCRCRCCAAPCP